MVIQLLDLSILNELIVPIIIVCLINILIYIWIYRRGDNEK